MLKFLKDLDIWKQGVVAVLFFCGLGFGVGNTFVFAGEFLKYQEQQSQEFIQYKDQQDYKWGELDHKNLTKRIWNMESEFGYDLSKYPPSRREEYMGLKEDLILLDKRMDALLKENSPKIGDSP